MRRKTGINARRISKTVIRWLAENMVENASLSALGFSPDSSASKW